MPSDLKLNIVEIKILIYSVILHDIGMTSDKVEENLFIEYNKSIDIDYKENLVNKYIDKLKTKNVLTDSSSVEFKKLLKDELIFYSNHKDNLKTDFYSDYIRISHVKRSKIKLFLLKNSMNFEYKGICLLNHISDVILAHGLDFKDLKNEINYPIEEIISNKKVNILFLSVLLRVGDLLDADISRTPRYLLSFFGFIDKKSHTKWEKSLSLIGKQINNYNVSFNYLSNSPEQERDIRKYITGVENQILKTNELLKYSSKKLNLSPIINLTVKNDGSYKSADKQITIEYDKVKKILMGTELYDQQTMFLRELIQNSRDACKLREQYCNSLSIDYKPKILIKYDEDIKELTIQDNGIGMNEATVNNFFIKIGNSPYSKKHESKEFTFSPIGNFGIGILSVFMVSNEIKVNSVSFNKDGFFDEPINIKLEIDEKYVTDYVKDENIHEGTKITLQVNDTFIEKYNLTNEVIKNTVKDTISNYFDVPIYINNYNSKIEKKIDNTDRLICIEKDDKYKINIELNNKNTRYENNKMLILSYNGIYINTIPNHRINYILPFLSYKRMYIEINGKVPISLKASREKIIEDEIFIELFNDINIDILFKMLENNIKNSITPFIRFNKTYNKKVYDEFIKIFYIKTLNNDTIKLIDMIKNEEVILIDKIYKNISTISKGSFINNKLISDSYNFTIDSTNGLFINNIKKRQIIINKNKNNIILYEKLYLEGNKNYELTLSKNRFFAEISLKNVLFLIDSSSTYGYYINKNHKLGKMICNRFEELINSNSFHFLYNLIEYDHRKINKKLKNKYKKQIPKQYLSNFKNKIYSKKSIKHINKSLNILLKKFGMQEYKFTKKDLLRYNLKKVKV